MEYERNNQLAVLWRYGVIYLQQKSCRMGNSKMLLDADRKHREEDNNDHAMEELPTHVG